MYITEQVLSASEQSISIQSPQFQYKHSFQVVARYFTYRNRYNNSEHIL